MSELLQAAAGRAAQQASASLQQASEAGSSFVRMAAGLMEAAQALPAGTQGLSQFCRKSSKPLIDAVAVLEETCRIVKVVAVLLYCPSFPHSLVHFFHRCELVHAKSSRNCALILKVLEDLYLGISNFLFPSFASSLGACFDYYRTLDYYSYMFVPASCPLQRKSIIREDSCYA